MAGLVGLALVLLFMLVYYRLPGLVADIALAHLRPVHAGDLQGRA